MTAVREPFVIIEAPSNLGLKPPAPGHIPGCYRLPTALRSAGLYDSLAVKTSQKVMPPLYGPDIDPVTGIRNAQAIHDYSRRLADSIEAAVRAEQFALVLGGDCSILLGGMLALRRIGHYGLCFIDGHADFLEPETSQTGGAAGMDLALVTGYGPALLTDLEGWRPLVAPQDSVLLANRDDPASYGLTLDPGILNIDLETLRKIGIETAAAHTLAHFRQRGVSGFWIHFDADVLDVDLMPAVDSPMPGGLTYAEMRTLLRALLRSDLAVGLEITIFDPDLDPDRHIARAFARELAAVLIR